MPRRRADLPVRFPVGIFTLPLEKLVENGMGSILIWHELSIQSALPFLILPSLGIQMLSSQ